MVSRSYRVLAVVSIILLVSMILYVLSTVQSELSIYNTGGNGASLFYEKLEPRLLLDIEGLEKLSNNTAVITPLLKKPSDRDYTAMLKYVYRGGLLIVLDEEGYSNRLFSILGLNIRVMNTTVLDEIMKNKTRYYPLALLAKPVNSIDHVLLYKPVYIYIRPIGKRVEVVAETSPYSYADMDGNEYYSFGEPMKSFVVCIRVGYGAGSIILISDKDFISNNVVESSSNIEFIEYMIGNRTPYYCILYTNPTLIDIIRYYLYSSSQESVSGTLYTVVVIVVGVLFSLVYNYVVKKHSL